MKHIKRTFSILLAALLAFGIAVPAAQAAPGTHVQIDHDGVTTEGWFLVDLTETLESWTPLNVSLFREHATGNMAFCLTSDAAPPDGDSYSINEALYNANVLNGIKAILLHGAPSNTGGLSLAAARYATQIALYVWIYETAGVGYYAYKQHLIRPAAGQQAVYDFYLYLLDKARNNVQSITFGISANPGTVTLSAGGGSLMGTATVQFQNLNGYYSIDESKLPSGVTIAGSTYRDGDTLTVTAPLSYAGQTVNLANILVGHDTRLLANIFFYAPDIATKQKIAVFDMNFQPVAWGGVSFTSEQQKGALWIDKIISDASDPAGFQFEVRDSSGTLIGTYTSDATGRIKIPDLAPGTYSITEINIPAGYILQGSNPRSVTVFANDITLVDVVNIKQKGQITVKKTNSDPSMGDYSLASAVFEILNSGGTVVDTITTGNDGKATSKVLPLGSYTVREKTAPEGFVRNTGSFPVMLSAGSSTAEVIVGPEVVIPNAPQTGRVTIHKTNANPSMGNYSLAGAVFEIYSGSTLVDTVMTDAAGNAQSKTLKLGYYTISEKTAPTGYVRNATEYVVHLAYAGQDVQLATASADVPEQPQVGIIHVSKSNGNPSMGDYSLAGAVFEVLNSGGTVVDTITTDAQGKAQSKQLPLGEYRITEKTAPAGFLRNTDTFTVTLTYSNQDVAVVYSDVTVPEQPQPGRINIKKTNANAAIGDYSLTGAVFDIFSGSALVDTVTTNSAGEAQSKDLPLGNYTVKERMAPYGFVKNADSFTANLEYAGQDVEIAMASVTIPEQPQHGVIRLTKTNANPSMGDYSLAGAVFEVRNVAGTLVDTITTNAAGKAQTKELPLGAYTVTEKMAPYGFVRNKNTFNVSLVYAGQDVEIAYSDVAVSERPQTGKIPVTKQDTVTGNVAQGDATLNGAVFEILASDQNTVVDTIYCGVTDKATSKELPLGTYYIKEKVPPVGYTHDTSLHRIVIAYGDQDIEVLMLDGTVRNKVIEGQVAIVKHTDLPMEGYEDNPQIEQPLAEAKFEIFLKSAGSYASAKETERDILITNSDGYAISKKLPYGVYTVREIEAPGDVKLVDPFDVFVCEDGKVYRYILNDPAYTARLKVVKLDSNTGKVIPAAGTQFRIKNLKTGEWVKQNVWYPAPAVIDTFETSMDGTLVLPEPLPSGDYELYEVKAPVGYQISSVSVKFTIHSSQQEAIVTVKMSNAPVTGKISVEKLGEMLVGTREVGTAWGTMLVPVFGMRGLVGAEFDIVAAADIVTPDGTMRAKKGEVVSHLITVENGIATSGELFLGNYLVVETKAPAGFVLDVTPHPVSLVYKDQNTAVVTSQVGVDNARQSVEIPLNKIMEKPVGAAEDFSAFTDVVFGLFTGEDIGGIIPKDALVATITLDENGKGVFSGDLPFGKFYVQELQTNPHYQLNGTKYPIDVAYAGQDKAVTKVQVNNGGAIPNELKQGKIIVEKRGEVFVGAAKTENGYTPIYELRGLPGATFAVIAVGDIHDVFGKLSIKKGTVVDTITTGEDGRAESKPLHLGRYEVVETAVPEGFVLDTERHSVLLGFDGHVEEVIANTVTVLNERQRMEINVKKTWEMPENPPKDFAPWKDILFGLYAKTDILAADGSVAIPAGALVETIAIDKDSNGKATTDLPFGEYFLQEIQTAKGYALDGAKHDIAFAPGEAAVAAFTVSAENKIQRGSLKIVKTFEGWDKPVAGVPFLIVGQTAFGEIRMEVKTDKNGMVILKDLPVGSYTISEQKSEITVSYVLFPAQIVTIAADKETVVKILNKLARGEISILKLDSETKEPLSGAVFGLYLKGKLVGEARTGKDGIARFIEVPFGDYEIRELSAPAGYKRSDDKIKVTVSEGKTQIKLSFTNERVPGEPVEPDGPDEPAVPVIPDVPGPEKLPKTGDSKTIVVVALVALILAGGVMLWLRKRGKDEDENAEEPAEKE